MMRLAYDKTAVYNLLLREKAQELLSDGHIDTPQYEATQTAFSSPLRTPNVFVRIGLFIFTVFCINSGVGLFILLFSGLGETALGVLSLVFAGVLTILNTRMIDQNHWYRNGSDNAMCYSAVGFAVIGIIGLAHLNNFTVIVFIFLTLSSLSVWYYGDPFLAVGALYALYIFLYEGLTQAGLHLATLPFAFAIVAATVYFFGKKGRQNGDWFYWHDCLWVMEIAGLVGFYGALNYLVNHSIFTSINVENAEKPLPMGWIFATMTAIIPLVYLTWGILKKDRLLWIMGALGIVASILTYRHYHAVMPIEWALTLAGAVLLVGSIVLIRRLRTPKNGFVFLPERSKKNPLEALILNEVLHNNTATPPTNSTQFGGGDFGGGGASDNY